MQNRRIVIARMPTGPISLDDFRLETAPLPEPSDGQILVRTRAISIDAANRAWMQGLTYRSPLARNAVMAGLAISDVVVSRSAAFKPGDRVFADSGWQDYAVIDACAARLQPLDVPLTHLLSVYGTSTLTAYHGIRSIAALQSGETVVVSAAGGSVGLAVGQIARIDGARVVGIAGGAAKCRQLVDEFGFDAAIDYKGEDLRQALKSTAPGGIDVYFDNVGGDILDRCLFAMAEHGRVVCCGAVSGYDGTKPAHGPRGVPGLIVTKRLTMRGFIVDDFAAAHAKALRDIRNWVKTGALRVAEDVRHGLEAAPEALIDQLAGGNVGKRLVVVDD